jgi:preprotein translocase subunit YajC
MNKLKKIGYTAAGVLALVLCIFLYAAFSDSNLLLSSVFLLAAFSILGLTAFLYFKPKFGQKETTQMSSHTMVDSLKRVFKVVTAEGHFTEIVDFKHTDLKIAILPSTKKGTYNSKSQSVNGV